MVEINGKYSINDLENPVLRNALNEYNGNGFIYGSDGDLTRMQYEHREKPDPDHHGAYSEGTPGGDKGLLTTVLSFLFG